MNKAGFSGKSHNNEGRFDDIPEALRDAPRAKPRRRRSPIIIIGGLLGFCLALAITMLLTSLRRNPDPQPNAITFSPQPSDFVNPPSEADILLNHFAYSEAPAAELQAVTADGRVKLRKAAAQQYQAMVAAARADGVSLVSISGFRSIQEQQHLFFSVKVQRGQSAAERAAVSAPPGYSEHHTGYTVDIGDGAVPATNLNTSFEKTAAFQWLSANAVRFSFEMSFPKDNPQGVSYEPWHWRYTGDSHSLETFYKAKNFQPSKIP